MLCIAGQTVCRWPEADTPEQSPPAWGGREPSPFGPVCPPQGSHSGGVSKWGCKRPSALQLDTACLSLWRCTALQFLFCTIMRMFYPVFSVPVHFISVKNIEPRNTESMCFGKSIISLWSVPKSFPITLNQCALANLLLVCDLSPNLCKLCKGHVQCIITNHPHPQEKNMFI